MTNETTYQVNEIFYSLQGEGLHTGTACVFLRLSLCNRRCSFCDTDFSSATPMTAAEIVEEASKYPSRRMVITGGEPLLQLNDELIFQLHQAGFFIAIETNGSLPVPDGVDWVTCSPKERPWLINRIDELKIVLHNNNPLEIATQLPEAKHYFVQPCSGLNTEQAVDFVLNHPKWRLSLQTHKLINIQ